MIEDAVWQAIANGLPSHLERQRWYADKLRPIAHVSLLDLATIQRPDHQILLGIVGVGYDEGEPRRYFLPMTLRNHSVPEATTIASGESPSGRFWVQDAIGDEAFREFLVGGNSQRTFTGESGTFAFEPWLLDGLPFQLEPSTRSSAATFEQSNSSILYGEQAIAKLYRRLEAGQNIEVDMNRYLAVDAVFLSIPKLISSASYRTATENIPLMLVQQHVGDHRDAWTALTDLLRHKAEGSLDIVSGLGRVTGEMHVALADAPDDSALAPEPVTRGDIDNWQQDLLRSARATDEAVAGQIRSLPTRSQQAANEYLDQHRDWSKRAEGFGHLHGCYKTRVHGDYHLGQILVTRDGRLLVVDFEGEPHRPAHERSAKYSPLRDVAGMLRSLNYATGVAASSHDVQAVAASRAWLEDWEQTARGIFLDAYRKAIEASPLAIVPPDDPAFTEALAALETDKALYEIRYELSSRPDWAWLPLDGLK